MSHPAFRGPHKLNFSTIPLGHNLSIRLSPSKYEFLRSYKPFSILNDVVVVHYSFFKRLCLIFKYFLSCIFPKK